MVGEGGERDGQGGGDVRALRHHEVEIRAAARAARRARLGRETAAGAGRMHDACSPRAWGWGWGWGWQWRFWWWWCRLEGFVWLRVGCLRAWVNVAAAADDDDAGTPPPPLAERSGPLLPARLARRTDPPPHSRPEQPAASHLRRPGQRWFLNLD
ncbi:hypothetical protein ZWY2020_035802 [Hordeum vulgare]|nr:hypothetical protein ZWY2020_035802 [Hordeum vulgare]